MNKYTTIEGDDSVRKKSISYKCLLNNDEAKSTLSAKKDYGAKPNSKPKTNKNMNISKLTQGIVRK